MRAKLDVPILEGRLVKLEPLSVDHAPDLSMSACEDRSSYGFTVVPETDTVRDYLADQFERAEEGLVPFAQIRRADDRAVGCTAYWDPRYWPRR
ncbi:MAG TPA: N-acetyltransferase, partial [Actinomycetota bacterium]|nr:N-acetyltransferase [Actinomycetota bacterium]